jgi:nitroreductase
MTTLDPVVEAILESATRAPSSHNTQPWRFRVKDQTIHLLADRTRALPVNDPEDRELVISCGCALFFLRAAAAGIGVALATEIVEDAADPDFLAAATILPSGKADTGIADLDNAIDARRTYRKRFEPAQVPDAVLDELCEAARAEGAGLAVLASEQTRHQAATLIAEGDAVLWHNPSWRRELAMWMHPKRDGDGLTVPWLMAPLTQAIVRSFDMGGGEAARDRQYADESPLLAVLTTAGDTQSDWLAAGQALGRVLLLGCRHGLQASYLNQPVQVATLRTQLMELLPEPGFPQILLRMGYPVEEIAASPRRHLRSLIDA